VTVKEYGHALARDAEYAEKARRIGDITKDISELLPDIVAALLASTPSAYRFAPRPRSPAEQGNADISPRPRLAFHPPCTLQHGQRLKGGIEAAFTKLGFEIRVATNEAHLCCGSAGTYSVLQPELAYALRDRKLGHLAELQPETIVSANIGCIQHLQSGTSTPVRHWIEVLDEALASA